MRSISIYQSFGNGLTKAALLALILLCTASIYGQTAADNQTKPWELGVSVTYPMADIYMVQGSYAFSEHSDLLCGAAFQNWENDQGQAHAYTLLLGYRRFLWRGLHAEVELWPAYNPFKSSVDGKTYAGMELWMSVRAGYKFDFKALGNDFYVLAQPSIGFGVARDNPWPEHEKDNGAIFEPQVIVGIKL